ncbi:MAG: hypothetical protein ABF904_14570 [Ethanoligenens sp.]
MDQFIFPVHFGFSLNEQGHDTEIVSRPRSFFNALRHFSGFLFHPLLKLLADEVFNNLPKSGLHTLAAVILMDDDIAGLRPNECTMD